MPEAFFIREFPNGLVLVGQQMTHVDSVAMSLLLPAGAARDSQEQSGTAAVIAGWSMRGAGDRDTRQLNDALDSLGAQHGETVSSEYLRFSVAMLARNFPKLLAIYGDVIQRPTLANAAFEPARVLALQDLESLEDTPARKCNILLRERFYPHPLGRCVYGETESLRALTPEAVRDHWRSTATPQGSIMAVAGAFDWEKLVDLVEQHFGQWTARANPPVEPGPPAGGTTHIEKDSAQMHIALAHRAAIVADERYLAARMAEKILSGGMGSRLFTKVREKRGLVYHVSTHYHSLKDHAGFFTYAGTTPEKAQETFQTTVGELRRLAEGIEEEEIARARTQLKSALIMQGEATSMRANALAADWHHLRRLRSLEEISAGIEAVEIDDVLAYLRDFPAENFTILTVGPKPLDFGG